MKTAFWLAPDRWDGIDPHKTMFWERRQRDVIDVRRKATPAPRPANPYLNARGSQLPALLWELHADRAGFVRHVSLLNSVTNSTLNFLRL